MRKILFLLVVSVLLVGCRPGPGGQQSQDAGTTGDALPYPWIDTHVHLEGGVFEASSIAEVVECNTDACYDAITDAMDAYNIRTIVAISPPAPAGASDEAQEEQIIDAAQARPESIVYGGGGNVLNAYIHSAAAKSDDVTEEQEEEFRALAEDALANGAVSFGEMSILHLSAAESHAFEQVDGAHPLFLLLADIAAENNVPIDIHMDLAVDDMATPEEFLERSSRNPDQLSGNLEGFELLLEHNRDARIVWAHVCSDFTGVMTVDLLRDLLAEHPNLYMQLRPGRGCEAGIDGQIDEDYLALFEAYPDRFVIGTDTFISGEYVDTGLGGFSGAASFLVSLPGDLQKKIGCENAVEVYNLDVGCD